MKYTAEEVRARFEAWLIREHKYAPEDLIWQEKRNCYADYATHLAWNAYRDAYADLAERIKADESAVPVGFVMEATATRHKFGLLTQDLPPGAELFTHPPAQAGEAKALGACPKHGVEYVGECSGCAMTLPEKDFTQPRCGTSMQVDPTVKPHTLADFVHAPDAERAQIGQQVAARVDEMMAEPVAQPADSGRVPDGWVLVPREPTAAMLDAAMTREDDEPLTDWGKIIPAPHAEIYKAMLAAAPSPGEP